MHHFILSFRKNQVYANSFVQGIVGLLVSAHLPGIPVLTIPALQRMAVLFLHSKVPLDSKKQVSADQTDSSGFAFWFDVQQVKFTDKPGSRYT